MKVSLNIKTIGLVLLLGYLSFIPSGPYPIFIAGGLKLDVFFAIALLTILTFYTIALVKWPAIFLVSWVAYIVMVFVSAIFSEDINFSVKYAFIISGYSFIALLVPVVFEGKVNLIRRWLFVTAIFVGILIIVLYQIYGFGHSHRFALAAADISATGHESREGIAVVDPNMTAAGLILSLIVYFPLFFKNRRYMLLELSGTVFIIWSVIILLSRSAILGFFVSVIIASGAVVIRQLIKGPFLNKSIINTLFMFIFLTLCLFLTIYINSPDVFSNLVQRILHSSEDNARISLLMTAWDIFSVSIKTLLIGNGFMTTNPHNEFMRTLSTTGLLGTGATVMLLVSIIYFSFKKTAVDNRLLFSAVSVVAFIFIITLFYGYTKLIWVAWMFLLFLYRDSLSLFCKRKSYH